MNAITLWMEKYFVPLAAKIGGQKHLIALRDAFIGTMPATMAGAIAVNSDECYFSNSKRCF